MPIEENGKDSLQEALKQLLSTPANGPETPTIDKGDDGVPVDPAGPAQEDSPSPKAFDTPAPRPAEPVYEVEIVPPDMPVEVKALDTAPMGKKPDSAGAPQPKASQPLNTILDGAIEIVVRPTVSLGRIAEFERALRQHPDVHWLGTFGKAKQGTTVKIQLSSPASTSSLFAGATAVEKVDVAKASGIWRAVITLPAAVPQPSEMRETVEESSPQPAAAPVIEQPPGPVAPVSQPASPATSQFETPSTQREIDIEASPVSSLDELNRLEKVLTSLAPGCRVVNVLSLDGVSTVLITLEGIDRSVLKARLPERMSGVDLDTTHSRVVAKLPERW